MRVTLPSGTPTELVRCTDPAQTGLVIAPDIFGLRPLYDELAARLSTDWRMDVCAVEPFPGVDLGPEVEPRFAAVPSLDDATHLRDLLEAAELLGTERVALLGFCMGGMYALKAARDDRFDRIVAFYGMIRLPEAWQSSTQGEPLRYLSKGHADRVLAIIGERDTYTPPGDVESLQHEGVRVERFPEAEHGFAHDAARPAHRPADAARAFALAREWLSG